MLKYSLFVLFFMSLVQMTIAQKVEVNISPEYKLEQNESIQAHLDSDVTGHYVYFFEQRRTFSSESTMYMTKYDNNFEELWSYEYLLENDNVVTYGLQSVNEKFIWLISEEDNKNTLEYSLIPIDREGEIGQKVKVNTVKFKHRRDEPAVDWAVSEDSTKIAVVHTFDRNLQRSDFEYNVAVLDDDLNKIWSQQILLGKSESQVDVLSSVIGNDGAHYMLVKEYETKNLKETKKRKDRRGKKEKVATYDLKIYKLGQGMDQPEVLMLDVNEKFARGASLKVAENGDITCVGMFSNLRRGNINGVYYLKMNSKGEPITSNIKSFSSIDLEYLGKRNTDKDRSGKEGIEGFFNFGDQLILSDGSVVVTAEENFNRTISDMRGNFTTTFYSNDIVVILLDSDGTITSIKLIPKRQSFYTDIFLSHVAMAVDGKGVYFFYNDDKDNMDRDFGKRPKAMSTMRDCVTACAHLDMDGNITRKALLDNKDLKMLLLTNVSKRVNENTMFFAGQGFRTIGKSNFRIGTIELK